MRGAQFLNGTTQFDDLLRQFRHRASKIGQIAISQNQALIMFGDELSDTPILLGIHRPIGEILRGMTPAEVFLLLKAARTVEFDAEEVLYNVDVDVSMAAQGP